VRRTKDRPLADGRIEPGEALFVFVGLSLLAVALVLTLDARTQWWAVLGAVLIVTYPFLKRFFLLPQAYLGAAFSCSILMAYSAEIGGPTVHAWLLFLANVLWTTAYDTMYGMADRDDDVKIGIKSSAILFGDMDRAIVGGMQAMAVLALILVGINLRLGLWYYLGVIAAAVFCVYQQALIRKREPEKCLRAFLNNNYFGMCVFAGIALQYLFD
jgi:4-hydroxybenzoate polyprenyltransferase